jgi:hypothetical protein
LDDDLDDGTVGTRLRGLGRHRLATAVRSDDERLLADSGRLQLLEARFSHVRSFAPHVLAALTFAASVSPSEVLDAVGLLQAMNIDGLRHVPEGAPTGFVPARWQPYLDAARAAGDDNRFKHYWELCVLFALQGGLRSGEIWVEGSRRYANPASYLIPPEAWPSQRAEALELTGATGTFGERLADIDEEMGRYLGDLDALLAHGNGPIRLDDHGEIHLSPLAAEVVDPVVLAERDRIVARLPTVPLTELLIEVDQETGFSTHLTHAAGATPRLSELEHRRNLYAAVLSQACNFGTSRMAELTGISPDAIDWTTRWYLREDTLRAANTAIVNPHHRHPLAKAWGGGTLSSSDGLRLPMRGKSLTARALSRYFVDEGVTTYTHVSDQHSTYGTQVIVSTEPSTRSWGTQPSCPSSSTPPTATARRSPPSPSSTSSGCASRPALPSSPRNACVAPTRLPTTSPGPWPGRCSSTTPQVDLVAEHWEDLLRIGASQARSRLGLPAGGQAPGRLPPASAGQGPRGAGQAATVHALRWFTDEAFRRRIGRQLNRGEALNDLRRFLFFAHRGDVRYRHHDDQTTQAHCLTLVTNACVFSTTGYSRTPSMPTEPTGTRSARKPSPT